MQFTTMLDLLGLALIVLAAALVAGMFFFPASFAVAGAGVLIISWLCDRKAGAKR